MFANLFTRDDTLLGVCEGIGEEFGFHPNYLRIVLAAMLLWNAVAVIGFYLAVGVVLMVSRWLIPVRRHAAGDAAAPVAGNDAAEPPLPLAA